MKIVATKSKHSHPDDAAIYLRPITPAIGATAFLTKTTRFLRHPKGGTP